ncbi:hypothetical protein [Herbaspirillum huttiense]|uniref:hypothetical protein n=1 Tax=Herbaspirillum huttiense TaxID=863372 RepID=UPI0031D31999
MKPFNLEAAKSGAPIVTRDGREARFIAHVPECEPPARLIVHLNGYGECDAYDEDGRYAQCIESDRDLFMKPQKRTVWVNLRYEPQGMNKRTWVKFDSEEDAIEHARCYPALAVAVPLEIEE